MIAKPPGYLEKTTKTPQIQGNKKLIVQITTVIFWRFFFSHMF